MSVCCVRGKRGAGGRVTHNTQHIYMYYLPRDIVQPAQVDPRAVVLRVGVGDPLVAGLGVVKGVGPEGLQDVAVVAEGACCARLICCMRFGGCG